MAKDKKIFNKKNCDCGEKCDKEKCQANGRYLSVSYELCSRLQSELFDKLISTHCADLCLTLDDLVNPLDSNKDVKRASDLVAALQQYLHCDFADSETTDEIGGVHTCVDDFAFAFCPGSNPSAQGMLKIVTTRYVGKKKYTKTVYRTVYNNSSLQELLDTITDDLSDACYYVIREAAEEHNKTLPKRTYEDDENRYELK